MNKYEPKPLIEEHYHIQMLIDGQQKRSDDREYHRNKLKEKEERIKTIEESKLVSITDFWCDKCEQDFKSMTVRQFEIDWSNPSQYIAFYKTKCDKGHWCIRLITDKQKDGYWIRSKAVAHDRGIAHNDIIQPHETGFVALYGKKL